MPQFKQVLAYDDVLIVPSTSGIKSRSSVVTSTSLNGGGGVASPKELSRIKVPIIAAPMDTVISLDLVKQMHECGAYAIWHRFGSLQDNESFLGLRAGSPTACSVGQLDTDEARSRLFRLVDKGCEVILIDVAHGGNELVAKTVQWIRNFPSFNHCAIIAGNVATAEESRMLLDAGADVLRVGIGSGAFCETRIRTGCGLPTFQSILDIKDKYPLAPLIADGGIKNSGDIVKALAAGADAVMLGRILAGTAEAPGGILTKGGVKYKVGRGMASAAAKQDAGMPVKHVEGASGAIPYLGTVREVIESLMEGVRSGMSYVGARNLKELRENAEFVVVSPAAQRESAPHSLLELA